MRPPRWRSGAVAVLAARPVGVPAIVVELPKPGEGSDGGRSGRCARTRHRRFGRGGAGRAGQAGRRGRRRTRGGRVDRSSGSPGRRARPRPRICIAAVLAPLGEVVAPPGSFNNELGHPWTVLRATPTTDLPRPGDVGAPSRQHRRARRHRAAVDRRWCSTSAPPTSASSAPAKQSRQRKPNCRNLFRPLAWSSSTSTTRRWPRWPTPRRPGWCGSALSDGPTPAPAMYGRVRSPRRAGPAAVHAAWRPA